MDITVPVTINTPARPGVFATMPAQSQDAVVVFHISQESQSELAAILGGSPSQPLTPTALAATYSASDLSAALSIKLSGK